MLAIPPFNYPVNLAVSKIAPALMAGNSVVLKPPTQVRTAQQIHDAANSSCTESCRCNPAMLNGTSIPCLAMSLVHDAMR